MRQVGDMLGDAIGLQAPAVVGKSDNGVRISDVDPLGIVARRIKCDSVGLVESAGEDG